MQNMQTLVTLPLISPIPKLGSYVAKINRLKGFYWIVCRNGLIEGIRYIGPSTPGKYYKIYIKERFIKHYGLV